MGYTRKILAEKDLNDKAVFYTDDFRIDLAESIHIHFRNFRLELSIEEWRTFARGIITAYLRWWHRGKPHYQRPEDHWNMFVTKVDPVAGSGEHSVIQNQLRVELSQFADYIHVHYRNTRYEFTADEFFEFADEITKSAETLRALDIMKDYPRRIGFYHIMQPKGRVAASQNSGGFTTHSRRFPDEKARTHDSVVLDEKTGEWKPQVTYHDSIRPVRRPTGIALTIVRKLAKLAIFIFDRLFKFF